MDDLNTILITYDICFWCWCIGVDDGTPHSSFVIFSIRPGHMNDRVPCNVSGLCVYMSTLVDMHLPS